ncbi:AUGMIN subunit 7 [Ranunculus cassubicifolius]
MNLCTQLPEQKFDILKFFFLVIFVICLTRWMMLSLERGGGFICDLSSVAWHGGKGSYDDRVEMLSLIVDLVEASCFADNPEWSVDEQLAKDIQLVDSIAERQAQIFSEECKLFPSDVQVQSIYPLPDISELELKLSEHSKKLSSLQQVVDDLASKNTYNPDEDYTQVESQLRAHLETFLETAKSFNIIYNTEIRPWTHMMEVPQLHGFGPAADRLLEAYKVLLKNLRNLRDSHTAVSAGSSDSTMDKPTSITKIIAECESVVLRPRMEAKAFAEAMER